MKKTLKFAVIAGEESGDLLAADLIKAARRQYEMPIALVGVGGQHLTELGLKSLLPMEEISLIGLTQILKKLPRLLRYIHQTASRIITAKPDCLIVIDAPDFTHRVAAKVRAQLPNLPIIQYVAPSVWAWRPQRAAKMRPFIDHILTVLPFETELLHQLNGPPASYVGHPLLFDKAIIQARETQKTRKEQAIKQLVVLPGSRRSEIRSLMPIFGETIGFLQARIPSLQVTLPTLPHLRNEVEKLAQAWPRKPRLVIDAVEKIDAFSRADAALAASGTVSLELALSHVPMVLCYKADWFAKHFLLPKITIWSAALPNIIADTPIVPEYYNEFARPALLARQLHRHITNGAPRQAQLEGFASLLQKMQSPLDIAANRQASSGERAARIVLDLTCRKRP